MKEAKAGMHIVYYVRGWPPAAYPNGVVTAVARLAPALREAGCAVTTMPAELAGPPHADDSLAPLKAQAGAKPLFAFNALRRRFEGERAIFEETPRAIVRRMTEDPALRKADIFEIEESFGWSLPLARRLPQPVVTRLHGPFFLTGAAQTDGQFTPAQDERIRREGEAIAAAALVTSPTVHTLDAVCERYGLALENARIIPNAAPTIAAADLWRLDAADRNEFLFIGRFDRIKGADILLRAFAMAAARRPDLKLTFAGPNDRPMDCGGRRLTAEAFLQDVAAPEIARRVQFLGPVNEGALRALRRRALACVIASRFETFSNVLVEAMAQGAPVIATRVGGMPEVARNNEEAVFVPAGDPAALAVAIEAIVDAPEYAARLGAAARARAVSAYSPAAVAAATVEAYRDLLTRTAKARAG